MASALAQCRSMRSARVLMPRRVRNASNGLGTLPTAFCRYAMRSARSEPPRTIAAPPMASECPLRYLDPAALTGALRPDTRMVRSEEHTSELQSHVNLVCRLLLEKKKKKT